MSRGVLVIMLVMSLSGCSFIFAHGPPARHQELQSFHCTESRAAPIIDTVLTGIQALALVSVAGTSDADWDMQFNSNTANGQAKVTRGAVMSVYVIGGLIEGFSAIYGFGKTSSCRSAQAELRLRTGDPGVRAPSPSMQPPGAAPGPYAPPVTAPPPAAPPPPPAAEPSPYAPPAERPPVPAPAPAPQR